MGKPILITQAIYKGLFFSKGLFGVIVWTKNQRFYFKNVCPSLEFVTGGVELLKGVLHGYAGGLIFMK